MGRGNALDAVGIRLVHPLQELAGIGRERLDEAPLPLGIQRVEGQRGFPRAGHTGDDDLLVQRDVQVDALEVVYPDAPKGDGVRVLGHGTLLL
jgi:hypothetical protein